ncbi:MAG: hypothetical protein ABW321_07310 [Polyangiales bacterium]
MGFESTSTHARADRRTAVRRSELRRRIAAGVLGLLTTGGCNAILGHEPRELDVSGRDAEVLRDAGDRDGGRRDAGELDAGRPDAGLGDAGVRDAGMRDAGPRDAGVRDAGVRDAGALDAGIPDAGTDPCESDPCQHGTCQARGTGYTCSCDRGYQGAQCETSGCDNLSCPDSTQCRTPAGQPGLCYPRDCGSMPGLCMAVNADGGGAASTELLTENNPSFDFRTNGRPNNNWNNRARYFAYVGQVQGWDRICVFPEGSYGGTPIVIPLGQARSTDMMFGASNAGPDHPNCP